MTELDKFKRRMVRTVARLLLHEKQPEQQVWDALRKESGCDCKLLWQRMRALTLKKLDRLLAADDQPDQIAAVARLTPTDWLLCDLVLVHEPVDLIGTKLKRNKDGGNVAQEPQPLGELFALVQSYGLEQPLKSMTADEGRRIAEAWTAATAYYNKTKYKGNRRQCSAMLMQRRWYQLKEATRAAFYCLWDKYRGSTKLWDLQARNYQPTELQTAIAKRYPHVITQPFKDWEEQIKAGLVILPKEFEDRVRNPPKPQPNPPSGTEGHDPDDIVVLEPVIETIDLGDSDSDEPNTNQARNPDGGTGQNPTDDSDPNSNESGMIQDDSSFSEQDSTNRNIMDPSDGLSNVKILEATHIPIQDFTAGIPDPEVKVKIEVEDPTDPAVKRRNLSIEMSKFLESTRSEVDASETSFEETQTDDLIQEKADEYLSNSKDNDVNFRQNDIDLMLDEDTTDMAEDNAAEDLIQEKADAYANDSSRTPDRTVSIESSDGSDENEITTEQLIQEKTNALMDKNNTSDNQIPEVTTASIDNDEQFNNEVPGTSDDLIQAKADEYVRITKRDNLQPEPVSAENRTLSDDEEDLYDDIIKQKADDFIRETDLKKLTSDVNTEIETSSAHDLLEGLEIVDDGIEYFEEDDDCETVIKSEFESEQTKPAKSEENASFDLKLLMEPVVYTLKLDQMSVFTHTSFESVANSITIEKALKESKPVSKKGIEDVQNASVSSDVLSQSTVDSRANQEVPDNDLVSQQLINQEDRSNDNDSASDDFADSSDESSDEINEDLKVKPTSYLLQKPRSRSYNPIQLCKNPDFNTRLRRLNVGFFTSSRNVQLLKACKPMTIDLNKAFESKLLNGTLYLKTDHVTTENNNDVQTRPEHIQNASVLPSTLPIQSLIDNAIENYLEKKSPTIPTVDLTMNSSKEKEERNKVINLKDINEIRRINQKLLTAQVTPIRMKIDENVTSEQTQPNDQPHTVQIIDEKDKEKTSDNHSDNPQAGNRRLSTSSTSKETPVDENTNQRKGRYKPPLNHLSNVVIGSWPCRREPVPWNKPAAKNSRKLDDFLIQIDTLNKMILKISSGTDTRYSNKINWVVNLDDNKSTSNLLKSTSNEPKNDRKQQKTMSAMPKLNNTERKKFVYCCWAKEKLEKMIAKKPRVYSKHKCARVCSCCCREELLKAYANMTPQKRTWLLNSQPTLAAFLEEPVDLDSDQQLTNACRSIEEVVQNTSKGHHTPVIRVKAAEAGPSRKMIKITHGETPNFGVQKVNVAEKSSGKSYPKAPTKYIAITSRETSTRLVLNEPPEHYYIGLPTSPRNKVTVATQTDEDETTFKEAAADALSLSLHWNPPAITAQPYTQNQIVIDASASNVVPNVQILKTTKQYAQNEKMIYLSSNSIAQQPSGNPIFLGANKILLTTVKLPKNLNKYVSSPRIDVPMPPLVAREPNANVVPSPLTLPAGVQLVLSANGELSYIMDPGIVLDTEQLDNLAKILEAVKTQLGASVTAQNLPSDEVVNLSDDEKVTNDQSESNVATESFSQTDNESANQVQEQVQENQTVSLDSDKVMPDSENVPNDLPESDLSVASSKIPETPTPASFHCELVVNLSNNENDSNNQTNSDTAMASVAQMSGESTSQITETQVPVSTASDPVEQNVNTSAVQEVDNEATDLNSSYESGVVITDAENKTQNTSANKEATKDSNEDNNSRNLLMDLMEMSGISAEDTRTTSSELVTLSVTNQPAPLFSMPVQTELPELSPVTSLAELKYACEQEGKFFKLDVTNGSLVRINVCIKKNTKVKKQPSFYVSTPSVIDLTEENESKNVQIEKQDVSKNYSFPKTVLNTGIMPFVKKQGMVIRNIYSGTGAKPPNLTAAKALRRGRPPSRRNASSLLLTNETVRREGEFKRVLRQRPERKQNLRIEAKIDMVDSDAPLEEEYLIDSDSSDDEFRPPPYIMYQRTRVYAGDEFKNDNNKMSDRSLLKAIGESPVASVTVVGNTNDEDSSDDEPLAKKIKRGAVNSSPAETVGGIEAATEGPGNDASKDNLPGTSVEDTQPVSDVDDMEIDETFTPTFIDPEAEDFRDNESDEAEEDCILGV